MKGALAALGWRQRLTVALVQFAVLPPRRKVSMSTRAGARLCASAQESKRARGIPTCCANDQHRLDLDCDVAE